MSINLFCPEHSCQKDSLVCIFSCKESLKKKCKVYDLMYDKLLVQKIEQRYIDKYGEPRLILPLSRRKRRKRKPVEEKQLIQTEEE